MECSAWLEGGEVKAESTENSTKEFCCKEKLGNGMVSRGGCAVDTSFLLLNKRNYRMCAC